MEALTIEIVNPKVKKLSEMLAKLRRNEAEVPSLEEITEEVEIVRQVRYDETK
jgi:ppGpp synthetase/RelA/SpoT-type nucleotidyltranferase